MKKLLLIILFAISNFIVLFPGCTKPHSCCNITLKNLNSNIHLGMTSDTVIKKLTGKFLLAKIDSGKQSDGFLGSEIYKFSGGSFYNNEVSSWDFFFVNSENSTQNILRAIQITINDDDSTNLNIPYEKLTNSFDSAVYKLQNDNLYFQGKTNDYSTLETLELVYNLQNQPSQYSFQDYSGMGVSLVNDNNSYWFYPENVQNSQVVMRNGIQFHTAKSGFVDCKNNIIMYKRKNVITIIINTFSMILFNSHSNVFGGTTVTMQK